MKTKILYVLFISLISSYAIGQKYQNVREYHSNGQLAMKGQKVSRFKIFEPQDENDWLKTGAWTIYYEDGNTALEGHYERDEKIGEWTAYYQNGEVYIQGKYEQYFVDPTEMLFETDQRYVRSVGTWIAYWDDGEVANLYTFSEKGTINTRVVNTRFEDHYEYKSGSYGQGDMAISIQYNWNWQSQPFIEIESTLLQMGSFYRYGPWKEYYPSGEISAKGDYNWKTNRNNGLWKLYYKDGTLKSERDFKDGKFDGIVKNYYENGQQSSEGSYKEGKCDGYYKTWTEKGELKEDSECLGDGKFSRKYYSPNGIIQSEGIHVYSEDKKHLQDGLWTHYYEDGKKWKVEMYEMGQHKGYWELYLEDGTQTLKDGNGEYRTYNDGVMSMKSEHTNGSRNGITTWYYPNGQVKQSTLYKYDEDSKPFGLRWEILSSFSKDGKERNKGTLRDGNGTWVSYDDEGNISALTEYKNGIEVE